MKRSNFNATGIAHLATALVIFSATLLSQNITSSIVGIVTDTAGSTVVV